MLAQFQSLYPQGSIISELIQIHHNKYIVRVNVQIEGVTRFTGMAAAEAIEVAEDRALERALMVLEKTSAQKHSENSSPQSQEVHLQLHNSDTTERLNEVNAKQVYSKQISTKTVNQSSTQEEPITKFESNNSSSTFTGQSTTRQATTGQATDESNPPIVNQPTIPSEPTTIPVSSHPSSKFTVQKDIPVQEVNPSNFDSEGATSNSQFQLDSSPLSNHVIETNDNQAEENQLPLMSSTNVQSFMSPENPLEEEQEVTAPISKKSTTSSRKKKKTEPKDATQPKSLLDPIAQIDVEMRRLAWTREQGREHLIQTYGKRARSLLTDEQLLEFLEYLKSQPTPIDPLDPGF